jgi:penicillin amidase
MLSIFRWAWRIFTGLSVLFIVILGLSYFLTIRSIPDYNSRYVVSGVKNEFEILRDKSNIPHIMATNNNDAFFGLGFAHAQDRLWQLTLMRRTAQGRLSEIFGIDTLDSDILLRELGIYEAAKKSVTTQDSDTLLALVAYSNGINQWVDIVNKRSLGRGAPEFFIFSNKIDLWQPADSLAIINLMALQLSGHLKDEILQAISARFLTSQKMNDLFGEGYTFAKTPFRKSDVEIDLEESSLLKFREEHLKLSHASELRKLAGASNVFAVSPERSTTNSTLLANDPHLKLTAPSIWYLARLELESGGVIGATIPGIPSILSGRTENTGWGITTSYVDDQDLFFEKVNPQNSNEYKSETGYLKFKNRKEIINIKGSNPKIISIQQTQNGPVITSDLFKIKSISREGYKLSLSWTSLSEANTTLQAAIRIMKAKNVKEILKAGEGFIAPAQNLIAIDKTRIAMKTIGKIPKRNSLNKTKGLSPSEGWLEINRWNGSQPYNSNPEFSQQTESYLGNTNNKIDYKAFPYHVSYSFGDTQRIKRLDSLISSRAVHSRDSFIEIQQDIVSYSARSILPLVTESMWAEEETEGLTDFKKIRKLSLDMLANWNGEMSEYLSEPLIYVSWMKKLQEKLMRNNLGDLSNQFTVFDPDFINRVFQDINGASRWCDLNNTTQKETCVDIARQSFNSTILDLIETKGDKIEDWQWGKEHVAVHEHSSLGNIPLLGIILNIRQPVSGGDNTLQRSAMKGSGSSPFESIQGAGYRGIYDLSDPDSSLFIISTGQSGNPLSEHYDDLAEMWRRGQYVPMSLDLKVVATKSVGLTTIIPNDKKLLK